MHRKKIGPLWLQWHWQNLDDSEKRERAVTALMKVLRVLGAASDENWRDVMNARNAFNDGLRGKLGHGWRNGRAWLSFYAGDPDKARRSLLELHAQWVLLKRQHSIGVSLDVGTGDGNDEVLLSVRVPLFGVYISCDRLPKRLRPKRTYIRPQTGEAIELDEQRTLSATWHDETLWFNLWADSSGWSSSGDWRNPQSRLRQPNIHVLDILLGKRTRTARTVDGVTGHLQMPEGPYSVSATLEHVTWKRPRWPRVEQQTRVHIECHTPIPVPGKGENGYDCDDDATYSFSCSAPDIETGARQLMQNILDTRERRAGENWVPSEGWPVKHEADAA